MRDAAGAGEVLGVRAKRRKAILTATGKKISLVRSSLSHGVLGKTREKEGDKEVKERRRCRGRERRRKLRSVGSEGEEEDRKMIKRRK